MTDIVITAHAINERNLRFININYYLMSIVNYMPDPGYSSIMYQL